MKTICLLFIFSKGTNHLEDEQSRRPSKLKQSVNSILAPLNVSHGNFKNSVINLIWTIKLTFLNGHPIKLSLTPYKVIRPYNCSLFTPKQIRKNEKNTKK